MASVARQAWRRARRDIEVTRRSPRVLCAGLVTLDVIQTVDRLPRSNVKQRALDLSVDFGGPAANAAGVAAALGSRTRLLTAIGSGPVADAVKSYLRRAQVIAVDLAPPDADQAFGVSTVLVEQSSGHRAVVSTNAVDVPLTLDEIDTHVRWADVVLVDGHRMELCLAAARAARQVGRPVVFDGGSWKPGTEELLRHVDVAVVSEDFSPPEGSVAALLQAAGVFAFGQSLGGRSWELEVAGGRHVIDVVAVPPQEMVDTVGAGDVLHGALAHALARWGLSNVLQACRFASEQASESCRAVGARGGGWKA